MTRGRYFLTLLGVCFAAIVIELAAERLEQAQWNWFATQYSSVKP